jgi:Uncharacterized conserved protein
LVAPYQVHGTTIIPSSSSFALPLRPEADGVLIDTSSNSMASLRFADCCPVVIAAYSPEPWMLLLHSGFIGTAKNIVGRSLAGLSENKPGCKSENPGLDRTMHMQRLLLKKNGRSVHTKCIDSLFSR